MTTSGPEQSVWDFLIGLFDKFENAIVVGLTSLLGVGFLGVRNLFIRVRKLEERDRARADAMADLATQHRVLAEKISGLATRTEMFERLDRQEQRQNEILNILQIHRGGREP